MEVARYRSVSSSDDDSGDEDETCWKRQATEGPNGAPRGPASRKVNNIWGSVLQEQLLTETLGHCSVEKVWANGDRACESYDFRRKALDPRESPPSSPRGQKRPVHERLGKRSKTAKKDEPTSKEALMAQEMAERLKEPKKDLLERVVRILGHEKAQQLLNMTEDIESAGGLMTCDKSRRRTPGGVFFHLLKNDHSIRSRQRRAIFANEPQERSKLASRSSPLRKQISSSFPHFGGEGDTAVVTDVAEETLEEGEITD